MLMMSAVLIVESNIPKTFDESKVFDYLLTYLHNKNKSINLKKR